MQDYFTLELADEAVTMAFGGQLAAAIVPGACVFLEGDLGAGKTTLSRGLLRGLGFEGKVKSPTYTLLESYDINRENGLGFVINHFDLYRFTDDEEWEAAGFREAFNAQSVCLIEWAEKAEHCLPTPDLVITLKMHQLSADEVMGRLVTVKPYTELGNTILESLNAN